MSTPPVEQQQPSDAPVVSATAAAQQQQQPQNRREQQRRREQQSLVNKQRVEHHQQLVHGSVVNRMRRHVQEVEAGSPSLFAQLQQQQQQQQASSSLPPASPTTQQQQQQQQIPAMEDLHPAVRAQLQQCPALRLFPMRKYRHVLRLGRGAYGETWLVEAIKPAPQLYVVQPSSPAASANNNNNHAQPQQQQRVANAGPWAGTGAPSVPSSPATPQDAINAAAAAQQQQHRRPSNNTGNTSAFEQVAHTHVRADAAVPGQNLTVADTSGVSPRSPEKSRSYNNSFHLHHLAGSSSNNGALMNMTSIVRSATSSNNTGTEHHLRRKASVSVENHQDDDENNNNADDQQNKNRDSDGRKKSQSSGQRNNNDNPVNHDKSSSLSAGGGQNQLRPGDAANRTAARSGSKSDNNNNNSRNSRPSAERTASRDSSGQPRTGSQLPRPIVVAPATATRGTETAKTTTTVLVSGTLQNHRQYSPSTGATSSLASTAPIRLKNGHEIQACDAFVCKIINAESSTFSQVANEVNLLANIAHPCIVAFQEGYVEPGRMNLLMEFVDGGDLRKEIDDRRQIPQGSSSRRYAPEQAILALISQLCLAMEYLHRNNILHRDLKPENIILSKKWLVKLADFGLARQCPKDVALGTGPSSFVGTPGYAAPEVWKRQGFTEKSDMFGVGCILYELVTLDRAFHSTHPLKRDEPPDALLVGEFRPIQRPEISRDLRSLVDSLLSPDPDRRPSALEVLRRPFIVRAIKDFLRNFDRGAAPGTVDKAWSEYLHDQVTEIELGAAKTGYEMRANKIAVVRNSRVEVSAAFHARTMMLQRREAEEEAEKLQHHNRRQQQNQGEGGGAGDGDHQESLSQPHQQQEQHGESHSSSQQTTTVRSKPSHGR